MNEPDPRIGITTTVPVEALFAAGLVPVDLNNAFVAHPRRDALVERAERDGFPPSICTWIKGIYGAVREEGISAVVAVTGGDCSNTLSLAEVLEDAGVFVVRFAYPDGRSRYDVERAIQPFLTAFRLRMEEADAQRLLLEPVRRKLRELDALTWYGNRVTGEENHRWLVASSDFRGDWRAFETELGRFLDDVKAREPLGGGLRIGVCGVPTIFDDLYPFLEERGARVVFNEVQRQFSMPYDAADLVDQFRRYTYPYEFAARLADIRTEAKKRGCRGLIHYVQSFCHRGIEDVLLRKHAGLPVLTLEGDAAGPMDGRSRVRVEAFVEMLARESA